MYRRPDGLYETIKLINGKRVAFRGKTESEVYDRMIGYKETEEKGSTFKEIAEDWKEEHFDTIEYNTQISYKPAYYRALEWFDGEYIKQIKPNDIKSFIVKFSKQGGGRAQKTVRTQLLVLNLIFTKATVDGDIDFNPCENVSIPKNLSKKKRSMPSDEDIQKIKNNVDAPFGLFPYFLLYTGCRKGEALALQFKDIDFNNKIIKIEKSVYFESNQPHIKQPKTEAGNRTIPLLDKLAKKLPKGKKNDYLFGKDKKTLFKDTQFKKLWADYCELCKISVTPHQLRHAYATILFEAGINEKDAQELLGHANISVTRDIYTHIRSSRKEKTAEILNNFNG
ncbi:tyrosine-type recombinase/integrase [Hydrogenoanaerobacterium saccharovorans]|nr:site-specific integrase [Hydrogenoanaerobacterium saccharovorans]